MAQRPSGPTFACRGSPADLTSHSPNLCRPDFYTEFPGVADFLARITSPKSGLAMSSTVGGSGTDVTTWIVASFSVMIVPAPEPLGPTASIMILNVAPYLTLAST